MKQDTFMDALEYIDDTLLESAADSMMRKKRHGLWLWVSAVACLAVVIGVWALLGEGGWKPGGDSVLQNGATVDSQKGPEQICPSVPMTDGPIEGLPPQTNQDPVRPEGYRPPPVTEEPGQIPKFEGVHFSAQQLGELFPDYYGDTFVYEQVCVPAGSLSSIAGIEGQEYINVYQYTDGTEPKESEVLGVVYDILPRLEELAGGTIPTPMLQKQSNAYFGTVESGARTVSVRGLTSRTTISYRVGSAYDHDPGAPVLQINGATLSAWKADTDQQIMESLSQAIPYLEGIFDMDLSACKIFRDYSDDGSFFYQMTVYLYSEDHVVDEVFEQYDDYPVRYIAGEVLCLNYEYVYRDGAADAVVCRELEFISQPRQLLKAAGQYEILSLAEAQALLNKGYVFSAHACRLCMQMQPEMSFADYDLVSLEYVLGKEYAIPFYTFYKKLNEDETGLVRYAKTMVPAIEASGMEEYFDDQIQYHQPSTD